MFRNRKKSKGQDRLKNREKADLGLFENQSLSEDGRRKGGRGLRGVGVDQDDRLKMLKQGHGRVYKLVSILFNMLYRALGTTAHAVQYNCFKRSKEKMEWVKPASYSQGLW